MKCAKLEQEQRNTKFNVISLCLISANALNNILFYDTFAYFLKKISRF